MFSAYVLVVATLVLAGATERAYADRQLAQSSTCENLRGFETLTRPLLPFPIGEASSGVLVAPDGVPYLVAVGEVAEGGSFATLLLNTETKEWTTGQARPFSGNHHCAVVFKNRIYLIGGVSAGSEGKVQSAVLYKRTNGKIDIQWRVEKSMAPRPFKAGTGAGSCAVMSGKIIYCGGLNTAAASGWSSKSVTTCGSYNPVKQTWSAMPAAPFGRNHASFCTDGTKLFIFGGRDGPEKSETMMYNSNTKMWSASQQDGSGPAPMPFGRGGMGPAIHHLGECYVFAGEYSPTVDPVRAAAIGLDPVKKVFYRVDVYNIATNTWRRAQDLPIGLHGISPSEMPHSPCSVDAFIPGGGTQRLNSQGDQFFTYRLKSPP